MDPRGLATSGISASERARRIQTIVHTALFAGVGIYAVILLFLRSEISVVTSSRPPGTALFLALAAIGIVQYAAAAGIGRSFLRSRRAPATDRVRLSFLLRGAAAEAIALYGLVLGFLGAPAVHVGGLFALAVAALAACAPGKVAWEAALRQAEGA